MKHFTEQDKDQTNKTLHSFAHIIKYIFYMYRKPDKVFVRFKLKSVFHKKHFNQLKKSTIKHNFLLRFSTEVKQYLLYCSYSEVHFWAGIAFIEKSVKKF